MNSLLERKRVELHDDAETTDEEQFFGECEEVLRYAIGRRIHRSGQLDRQLQSVLKELDIRPFTQDSVERYQKHEVDWRNKIMDTETVWSTITAAGLLTSFVVVVPALLASLFVSPLFALLLLIPAIYWTLFMQQKKAEELKRQSLTGTIDSGRFTWRIVPLSAYSYRVPEFALQTALDIAKRVPQAKFCVSELVFGRIPAGDPFLSASTSDGGATYYIEVWNEPDFKQERIV